MTSGFLALARPFLDQGVLAPAEVHTIALVAPRFGEEDPVRMLGLAFAARGPRVGHVGVDLLSVARTVDDERAPRSDDAAAARTALPWPEPHDWLERTLSSPLILGSAALLVAEEVDGRTLLSTRRMHTEEARLASALSARARLRAPTRARVTGIDSVLARLFPGAATGEGAAAVRLAEASRLAIVVGGPGTGKTFSIARLLAALLEADHELTVRLAAPTGKAAVRMREALREAADPKASPSLEVDEDLRARLSGLEAATLHRLLGVRPDGSVRHGPSDRIAADVLIIDEASMIDLVLMRQLLEAIGDDTRLILLGDRDQLASVEAGTVLADIVDAPSMAEKVQRFTRSQRFAGAPDVARVAACLQGRKQSDEAEREQVARAVEVMTGRAHAPEERHPGARIRWLGGPARTEGRPLATPTEAQLDALVSPYVGGFELLDAEGGARHVPGYASLLTDATRNGSSLDDRRLQLALLEALDRYRVLTVHRRGPLGVTQLDEALGARVRAHLGGGASSRRHWSGRPILITENAYELRLMNGDVGLVLRVAQGFVAVFRDEQDEAGVRAVPVSRLPAHEGALAMTIHKSQGSQFDRVALVLAGRASPIQTRELVYTGVTRAKNQLTWLGDEDELTHGLLRRIERLGGLRAKLG